MLKRVLQKFGISRYRGYTVIGQKYKPMLQLLAELRRRNIKVEELKALEVFGCDGLDHTTTYANEVKSLEVWEITEKMHSPLIKNLPSAEIKIVDSYEALNNSRTKYDFIVVDNVIGSYGTHCDHFDLFPDLIFKATNQKSLLVLNIIPRITKKTLKTFPNLQKAEYLETRKNFYNVDDPINIPMDHIIRVYKSFVEKNNYKLLWYFQITRSRADVYYLIFRIKKPTAA